LKKGFTLIELLVVIGIIGILAVFLVPNLLGARDKAKEAAVKGVLHSVQLAIESYQLENETYPVVSNIGIETLCRDYLIGGGYMATIPNNPFTGQPYKDSDLSGKIVYNFNNANSTYTLTGYNRTGMRKVQELTNL